ncbi:MAG: hypothetical protein QS721_01185 [Candidatus Endonucleobacter sp. (ex Gigantidas childressi)]|nr:hypothetical protein [Candidatus Endonucleobacter sp. (ex Gigantidas childressi)]
MSDGIQGAGNQPVNYRLPVIGNDDEIKEIVSAGLIGGDAKLQMIAGQNAVAYSPLAHRPSLSAPKEMSMQAQAAAHQAASADLLGLGKSVESASQETAVTMVRVQLGIQTPQDQEVLQRNTKLLGGAANYIESLFKDQDQLTTGDKQALLGGQGFNDEQIGDLLGSRSDTGTFQASAKEKHGDAYSQRKADLIGMGYDDNQADMLLSLSDDSLSNNDLSKGQLKKLFSNNPEAKKLIDIGFDENKIKELLSLVDKGVTTKGSLIGSEKTIQLLGRMGFGEKEAKILIATGSADKLKEQLSLLNRLEGYPEVSQKMLLLAANTKEIADSPNKAFLEEHLKQLADIFLVLELIHKMSVQQRRFAREARSAEYESAKQSVLKQVDHIKSAAVLTLVADVVQGSMSIAGGALSMKAGASGTKLSKGGKGGKSSAGSKIDDIEVKKSTPDSKSSGITGAADEGVEAGGAKSKKKTGKSSSGKGDDVTTSRIKNTDNKAKSNTKAKRQAEQDASASAKKKSEGKLDDKQDDIQQNQENKKEVTIDQDKQADQSKAAGLDSNRQQKLQNDMGRRQGQAMAANSIFTGVGQAAGGLFRFAAAGETAEQKEDEAIQKTHENAAQSWNEWMQLQQDQVKNAQSKIEEINRITFDTLKTLSRG